jgi:hypothetical protein
LAASPRDEQAPLTTENLSLDFNHSQIVTRRAFERPHFLLRQTRKTSTSERTVSDQLLFSMGGVSLIFAIIALAMLWPV